MLQDVTEEDAVLQGSAAEHEYLANFHEDEQEEVRQTRIGSTYSFAAVLQRR